MVLLGESYYADRSSKQTTEVLTRRGKALESQVQSLKAELQDLEAEVAFFDATASESVEGLVEIREEIVEETSYEKSASGGSGSSSMAENDTQKNDDEEYARILARIAELEKEEEEEAEKASENNEDERERVLDRSIVHPTMDQQIGSSEVLGLSSMTKAVRSSGTEINEARMTTSRNHDQLKAEASNVQVLPKDECSHGECLTFCQPHSTEVKPKENTVVLESKAVVNKTQQQFDGGKAFTGSIVEHSPNFDMQPREQIVGRTSKPVSRFKMQRK
ncbi:unnamed protein product [Cuscuta campestris]|uniref:Uncharacterized protein n=1 Tax=Cuscuta campestris TaxID=132261 RepID=A0A484LE18_9ASTE|nr:unnamed protein product [Cuscuta campestris]